MSRIRTTLLLLWAIAPALFASVENDTLLNILKQELQADMTELSRQQVKPYFMSFRVLDNYQVGVRASFGSLQASVSRHSRSFTPQLRVGSPELDNFKFDTQGSGQARNGQGSTLPLDCSSADAIRQNIWSETLRRYKIAQDRLTQAITRSKTMVDNEDSTGCFTPAKAEQYYEEPLTGYELSQQTMREWEGRLTRISAVFRQWKDFTDASVELSYDVQRQWFVNTEGACVVQNRKTVRLMLQAQMKAEDGMELPLYEDFMCYDPDSLPSEAQLIQAAQQMGERLVALSKAPIADPYTGPAIMSGPASGVFFHEIFGHRLEAHRMKSGGQTFKKMVGQRILPETFQVFCDPTISTYHGNHVWGFYKYDDEGVRARRVDNVVDGVLRNFLVSRVPIDGFLESNGHGRTADGNDPVSRQSNLIVETTKPYTDAQLRQMLREEARRQGKDYGYYFKSVTSGYTLTGEGGSLNSFNVTPLEVYRVFVDGRPDQLVRGVDMIGTPLSMFSNIAAGGDTPSTFVGQCGAESGWVPVTGTAPMIYVSKIETQRRQKERDLPTVLPAPDFAEAQATMPAADEAASSADTDSLLFRAMADEMARSQQQLRLGDYPTPFFYNYSVSRSMPFRYVAELGAITLTVPLMWQISAAAETKLGNYHQTSDVQANQTARSGSFTMTPSYDLTRRTLWQITDRIYKAALQTSAAKQNQLARYPLPEAEAAIDDLEPLPATTHIQQRTVSTIPDAQFRALACRLSAVFQRYPMLTGSSVIISGQLNDAYRLTSEGQRLKTPHDWIEVYATADTRTESGTPITDQLYIPYATPQQLLADADALEQRIGAFADLLMARRTAPMASDDYYAGPVLMEGQQVPYSLFMNFVQPTIQAQRDFTRANNRNAAKLGRKIMDSRLTLRQLTDSLYKGQLLLGHYNVDAYGVRPQALTLVENGIFRQMINGRYPALKAPHTTGNMRHPNAPGSTALQDFVSPGVLQLTSAKTQNAARLRKQLLRSAKDEGYDYAYIVRRVDGVANFDIYRVDVNTGRETLYYTPSISFATDKWRRLAGISTEEQVLNTRHGNGQTAISIIAPQSILFDGIEVPAPTPLTEAAPALTYPLQRK